MEKTGMAGFQPFASKSQKFLKTCYKCYKCYNLKLVIDFQCVIT